MNELPHLPHQERARPKRFFATACGWTALALFWNVSALASDSVELQRIHAADQADRVVQADNAPTVDWATVAKRDQARARQVLLLRDAGKVETELDYARAATVMLHGPTSASIVQAYGLVEAGLRHFPNSRALQRLRATAWDRLRMAHGRSQWFGTQLTRVGQGTIQLYDMDRTAMTEDVRVALGGQSDVEIAAAIAEAERVSPRPRPTYVPDGMPAPKMVRLPLQGETLLSLMVAAKPAAQFYVQAVKVGLPLPREENTKPSKRYIYMPLPVLQLEQTAESGRWMTESEGLVDEFFATVADVTTEAVDGRTWRSTVRVDDKVLAAPVLKVDPRITMVWTIRTNEQGGAELLSVQDGQSGKTLYATPGGR